MTSQQVGLLLVQFSVSIGILAFIGILVIQNHENRQKYRLFAVRDHFLYLAATGVLPETSMVFKVFYGAMNIYISELDSVTIVSFVKAAIAVRTELEKQNQKRLGEALRRAPTEVQELVDEFIHVIMDALRYNSPMLTLALTGARHCTRLFALVRRIRRFPIPVYDTYRYYEGVHGRLGLTA